MYRYSLGWIDECLGVHSSSAQKMPPLYNTYTTMITKEIILNSKYSHVHIPMPLPNDLRWPIIYVFSCDAILNMWITNGGAATSLQQYDMFDAVNAKPGKYRINETYYIPAESACNNVAVTVYAYRFSTPQVVPTIDYPVYAWATRDHDYFGNAFGTYAVE